MAHQATITTATKNVGWFDQNWRYDYTVTWQAGNGSIREVKINKTVGAGVSTPARLGLAIPPRFVFNDPRIDLFAPTGWLLRPSVAGDTQFEFMLQPPGAGGPLQSFIPPLIAPAPFVPAPPPFAGKFRMYSIENPVLQQATTIDHVNGQLGHSVQAPNDKTECTCVSSIYAVADHGYRYDYSVYSREGYISQIVLFLAPEVAITDVTSSHEAWTTFRPGFDTPRGGEDADGEPTDDERGILYFGSFEHKIGPDDGPVTLSFVSESAPGYITVLGNKFAEPLIGPVGSEKKGEDLGCLLWFLKLFSKR